MPCRDHKKEQSVPRTAPFCVPCCLLTPVSFADSPFQGHADFGFAEVGRLRCFDAKGISLTLHRAAEAAFRLC